MTNSWSDCPRPPTELVYRTVYLTLGTAADAEDILQEVFLQVHRSLDGYDPARGAFSAWLYRRGAGPDQIAPHDRVIGLAENRASPRDRPEQEIAGYRDVLATIHGNHANMTLTLDLVRGFHRELFQYTTVRGGDFKLEPVPAYLTRQAMDRLQEGFKSAWETRQIEPLLVMGAYVFDFLCVHPFLDGNGRLSRLLTLLLLYQAGYGVGRFISLERVVEGTRESYYDALAKSSRGWHEGSHSLIPWWEYLLGVVVLSAYREFETRAGAIVTGRGAPSKLVVQAIERLQQPFRLKDVQRMAPGVSRPTINRVMRELRMGGKIRLISKGRDATWERVE